MGREKACWRERITGPDPLSERIMQAFDRYGWLLLLVIVMIVAAGGIIALGISELEDTLAKRTGWDLEWTAIFLPLWGALIWMSVRAWQEHRHAVMAGQTIKQSQAFLQSSLDALTSHIAILDEEATIIAVNKAWREFGDDNQLRDPQHGLGRNYLRICTDAGEESEEVAEKLRAVLHGDQSVWTGEYPCHAPGEKRWFTVRISRFVVGGKVRAVVDHQNVTESWLTAQALHEGHTTMNAILDGALSAHVLMDNHGMVTRWNPQAEKIFGWSSQEALGRRLVDLAIPPGYREAYKQGLKRFLADGTDLVLEKRLEIDGWHKEGRAFPVELTVTAIQKADGYVFSAFVQDITERVERERRLALEHRIAELLLEEVSLEAASPKIMEAIGGLLRWKVGILWEVDDVWQTLRCAEVWTDPLNHYEAFVEQTNKVDFPVGIGLPGRTWASGRVEWMVDVTRDGHSLQFAAAAAGLHAAFAFPIGFDGKVDAVVEFFAEDIRPPDQKVLDLFNGIATQISQFIARRTAEQKLMRSEARFSGILQLADDAIVTIDDSERILLFNQGAQRTFGYAAEEVLGQPIDLLIPEWFRGAHHRQVPQFSSRSTFSTPMGVRNEITGRRKNGEDFPAEASLAKVSVEGQTT